MVYGLRTSINVVLEFCKRAPKVSWDRFVQIPRIEAFGWNRYAKAMEHVKEKAAQILAIQLVLEESIKRKESKDIQNQLFRKGIRHLETNR